MEKIGIKLLKNNLSRYLKKVENGETIWVTNRNEVIAEIRRPSSTSTNPLTRLEAFIQQQERKGTVKRASSVKRTIRKDLERIRKEENEFEIDFKEILDDARSDRF